MMKTTIPSDTPERLRFNAYATMVEMFAMLRDLTPAKLEELAASVDKQYDLIGKKKEAYDEAVRVIEQAGQISKDLKAEKDALDEARLLMVNNAKKIVNDARDEANGLIVTARGDITKERNAFDKEMGEREAAVELREEAADEKETANKTEAERLANWAAGLKATQDKLNRASAILEE